MSVEPLSASVKRSVAGRKLRAVYDAILTLPSEASLPRPKRSTHVAERLISHALGGQIQQDSEKASAKDSGKRVIRGRGTARFGEGNEAHGPSKTSSSMGAKQTAPKPSKQPAASFQRYVPPRGRASGSARSGAFSRDDD